MYNQTLYKRRIEKQQMEVYSHSDEFSRSNFDALMTWYCYYYASRGILFPHVSKPAAKSAASLLPISLPHVWSYAVLLCRVMWAPVTHVNLRFRIARLFMVFYILVLFMQTAVSNIYLTLHICLDEIGSVKTNDLALLNVNFNFMSLKSRWVKT